jgi:hypothetical protein
MAGSSVRFQPYSRGRKLHLGHSSPAMTLRYLSILTAEKALRIQQDVEFDF